MRPDARILWEQACEEVADARALARAHRWAKGCFALEQAVQMAIKALLVERSGRPHPRIHNLQALGVLVSAPAEVQQALIHMMPYYLKTRYPDVSGAVPAKLFTRDHFAEARTAARTALEWVARQLGTDAPETGSD